MKRKWHKVIAQVMLCCLIVATFSGISNSSIVRGEEASPSQANHNEIPEHSLRVHYQNTSGVYTDLGLWLWGDVATASEVVASWPTGATPFVESQQTTYGAYVDIPLKEDAGKIYFLIVNRETGDKEGHEISVVIPSPDINEVWVNEDSNEVSIWEPVVIPDNTIRIHLERADQNYDDWGLWLWGDVVTASESVDSWPTGAAAFSSSRVDSYGSYVDIEYKSNAQSINFIVVNRVDGTKDGAERAFSMMKDHNQIFLKENNPGVFTSPHTTIVEESSAHFPEWSKDSTIYEVNIRQYTEEGTFKAFESHLPRLKNLGVEILWFMPIHPISEEGRVGTLGSYYAPADYKAVNPEFGTMDDFKSLVKTAHDLGFKVVLDWVANHTGWDHEWIANEGWYTEDEEGNIVSPNGWNDVADLNFDNADMRAAMIDAMKFWVEEIDVDGYRADFAAGVPKDFWETAREELDAIKPVYMLAEDDSQYGLLKKAFNSNYGWDLFYNIMLGIAEGEKEANEIKSYIERSKMLYPTGSYAMHFTTNHDINSWEGTTAEMLGEAQLAMATLTYTLPGMPMIYSGQEAGLDKRLMFFEKDQIDWSSQSLTEFYTTLTKMKKDNEALWNGSFGGDMQFIDTDDARVLAFEREKDGNKVITVLNLSSETIEATVQIDQSADSYYSYFTNKVVQLNAEHSLSLEPWEYYIFTNKLPETPQKPDKPQKPQTPVIEDEEIPVTETDTYAVQSEDLRNLVDNQSIDVPNNYSKVSFPIDSVDLLGDRPLSIQFNGVNVTLTSTVLEAAKAKGAAGNTIVLQVKEELASDADQVIEKYNNDSTTINYASGLYQFSLAIMSGSELVAELDTFDEPITLVFDLQGNPNPAITSVFYLDEQELLHYIGGTIKDNKMTVDVKHFSHYSVLELDKTFDDVEKTHEALSAIKALAAKQIVNGVAPSLFAPDKEITRAEFAALLVRALQLDIAQTDKDSSFSDVSSGAWYANYIYTAYSKGLITGRSEQNFAPNELVTAQEMAAMLVRAYKLTHTDTSFSSLSEASAPTYKGTSPWAIEYVRIASELGLLGSDIDVKNAEDYVTRAETAQFIYRLITIQ